MTLVVGILVFVEWLVPYPNNIGGKDCMLILNNIVKNAWFAKGQKLSLQHHRDHCSFFQHLSIHLSL